MADDEFGEMTLEDVERAIREMRSSLQDKRVVKAIERLLFIRILMLGYRMDEACRLMDISVPTGYAWKAAWASEGMYSVLPSFSGGRKPLLTPEEFERAANEISAQRMTTAQAREFIRRRYGVDYSAKQIGVKLKRAGLRHVRPYELEFSSEEEASEVLGSSSAMRWTR